MKCLRCETIELEVQARGEGADVVEIDACPACRGIWLDAKELAKIDDNFFVDVEAMELEAAEASAEDRDLRCPRCEGAPRLDKVRPRKHRTLIIDKCPACHGYWLDRGELEKIRDVSDKLLVASLLSVDD
jgi:Zn-finger nucleic acid-binding protein